MIVHTMSCRHCPQSLVKVHPGMNSHRPQTCSTEIIYIKAIWVIDQVGLQVGLRALNDRVRMNFMCEKPTKAII